MGSSTGVVLREHLEGVLALMLRTAPLQSPRAPLQLQEAGLRVAGPLWASWLGHLARARATRARVPVAEYGWGPRRC